MMARALAALGAAVLLAPTPPAVAAGGGFADRPEVRAFVAEMHEKHGFAPNRLLSLFQRAEPQPRALRAIRPPPDPSVRSWTAYRARYVEAIRIDAGLRFWQAHREALAAAQQRYGVPEEIIVAIIGVETLYGRDTGRFPTLATLATLAFDYPPRSELFRGELEALLLLSRQAQRDPLRYRGSYAGAIGLPQFLPSSIRSWAVDFDDDGRIDLDTSPADAIGSVASFLHGHGWEAGAPVQLAATVAGADGAGLAGEGILPRLTPAEMAPYGVASDAGTPQLPCALIDLPSPDAPTEYRLGFHNFYVLTRYNRSSFYATAVYDLARALRHRLPQEE